MNNLTNVHRKLEKIQARLSALDTCQMSDTRRSDIQLRLMTPLLAEVQREARECSRMTAAALARSRKSAARTAKILRGMGHY